VTVSTSRQQIAQHLESEFLAFFPHRYDFLWAKHPTPGERPQWQTQSKFPLSDRAIAEGKYLYGVRFGPFTQYLLIDLDTHSLYHPKRDRQILSQILEPLERIGITDAIALQSSRNGGIHLYIPFDQPIKSWLIALVVQTLLERAGFHFKPGQIEIYPNPRSHTGATPTSLYQGHRLPLQNGSFLLDREWQPSFTSKAIFVERWEFTQKRNKIDVAECERIAFQSRSRPHKLTSNAQKFYDDLQTEIQPGWTGQGQTNCLLGRIAQRLYIFDSIDNSTLLTEDGLTAAIAATARSLPGYEEFCRHHHNIEQRSRDWARDIIADPRYYPYKRRNLKQKQSTVNPTETTWNERQRGDARARIQNAIAQLIEQGSLPDTVTERLAAFKTVGINRGTLYNHPDLWHPSHLPQFKEFNPIVEHSESPEFSQSHEFNPSPNKFVPFNGLNEESASVDLSSSDPKLDQSARIQREKNIRNSKIYLINQFLQQQNNVASPPRPIERSFLNRNDLEQVELGDLTPSVEARQQLGSPRPPD